ncbi:hypothetical protein ACWF94_05255 [Streptomyces sp. NPDC055078]
MAYGKVLRAVCGVVVCGLLWTGCSGSDDDEPEPPGRSSAASGTKEPGGPDPKPSGLAFSADPARAPKTEAAARKLATTAVAGPELWGPGYVKRTPFLSRPDYWPVLDERCVWRGGTRPATVLHSVTAYSELPASAGKGPVRVAATVTVHRDKRAAEWEMAETLEEALRCPNQTLREGERVAGLLSMGSAYGTGGNFNSEDSIGEVGEYHSAEFGKPYEYGWFQSRLGQVTVATVMKGAKGYTADELNTARAEALTGMMNRVEKQLEAAE